MASTSRTALFSRRQPGGVFTVDDVAEHGGNIWFVDSGQTSTGADSVGHGKNPDEPFLTLDYAIGQCTANNHDTIYLMPGHSESWTTTGTKVTLDVAGVRVVGLGEGSDRATFSFGHTGTTWTWSAANVTVENCLFTTAVDSVVTYGTISGADAHLINCEGRDTTDIEVVTDWTVTGDRFVVDGYFKNGYTSGNANDAVFSMNGVGRAEIKNCRFITKVLTAVVEFVTTACTAVEIHDCDFLVSGTTDYSKNAVDTITGSSWGVWDSFDLGAGASFSGGSGGALAGDDVGALATDVSTYHSTTKSVVLSNNTSVITATSTDVSTSDSTAASTNVSAGTSSADSTITEVSTDTSTTGSTGLSGSTSVGTASSTAASVTDSTTLSNNTSVITATSTDVSTTGSTTDSGVTSVGASEFTSWSTAWSTQDSTYHSELLSAIDST